MIDRMTQEQAGSGLPPQVDQLKETALDMAATARERLTQGTDRIREFIIHHPARSLGIAFGTGVFFGWLIKRR
ncbi:MAG TPA: hypothetical protein VF590_03375 [Isosphaeraceae bacterium]|jgi:ElaB/YqjD/DUF883 family membrane-anchored ribosome-binding protein